LETESVTRLAKRSILRTILGTALASLVGSLFLNAVGITGALAEDGKSGDLEIAVSGLETDRGVLMVALMNSADAFENNTEAFRDVNVPVKNGKATATLRGIPYGTYAVKTYHDENSNGKLDTNFVGFPKEAFGFSNDAMGRFGPPTFEQAKFEFASGKLRIEINSN